MTLRHAPDAREVEQLGERGWFVRDGFLGASLARAVRAEAPAVELRRAAIRKARELDDAVRTDEIAWVEEQQGALGQARACFEALRDGVNQAAFLGLRGFDLQLARYAPGGQYVRHRDAFPGSENRRLTAIVYLNDGWVPANGGALELFVDPAPVVVEPVLDRLVVFLSERIEHAVQPCHAERWALTAWFGAR
ncbi:MAG: 2OG-Fe(II) oxygenase [Myxococcaceae bacterium]